MELPVDSVILMQEQPQSLVQGEVRWYHVARSRAARKMLDRSIARFVEMHRAECPGHEGECQVGGEAGAFYRAILQREGQGHLVSCQIEVYVAGERKWSGSWVGQGLQDALKDCLAHMRLVPEYV
jgi:hypothetical protein